jgi:hypothetical protein
MGPGGRLRRRGSHQDRLWFVLVKRGSAFSAQMVTGPKLDEVAVVATNYFPGINRG